MIQSKSAVRVNEDCILLILCIAEFTYSRRMEPCQPYLFVCFLFCFFLLFLVVVFIFFIIIFYHFGMTIYSLLLVEMFKVYQLTLLNGTFILANRVGPSGNLHSAAANNGHPVLYCPFYGSLCIS